MTYCAFLRAINVGTRKLAMADLRALVEGLGFDHVRTVLQTGNVIFESRKQANAAVEHALESALAQHLGKSTSTIVRTAEQIRATLACNPFIREAASDPSHLVAVFLREAPAPAELRALEASIVGRERIALQGDVLYAVYPDGIGESKLTAAMIDRRLQTTGTARNWNTLLKIAAESGGS